MPGRWEPLSLLLFLLFITFLAFCARPMWEWMNRWWTSRADLMKLNRELYDEIHDLKAYISALRNDLLRAYDIINHNNKATLIKKYKFISDEEQHRIECLSDTLYEQSKNA